MKWSSVVHIVKPVRTDASPGEVCAVGHVPPRIRHEREDLVLVGVAALPPAGTEGLPVLVQLTDEFGPMYVSPARVESVRTRNRLHVGPPKWARVLPRPVRMTSAGLDTMLIWTGNGDWIDVEPGDKHYISGCALIFFGKWIERDGSLKPVSEIVRKTAVRGVLRVSD